MRLDIRAEIAPDPNMTLALEMATCDACHEWSVVNLAADHPEPCPSCGAFEMVLELSGPDLAFLDSAV